MKITSIPLFVFLITLSGCGPIYNLSSLSSTLSQNESTMESSAETTSESESSIEETSYMTYPLSSLSGTDLVHPDYAHWLGRTVYDTNKSANMMYYTGTGFDVRILGTELSINFYLLKGNGGASQDNYVYVTIDGEIAPMEGRLMVVSSTSKTLSITGLTYGYHTISLIRRNEPVEGNLGIVSMTTDGFFCEAPTRTGLKFSIIGASAISGHGALGLEGQEKTTANSSSLHSFGYLTSRMFDGEVEFVSGSGWGVVYGYNSGNSSGTGENITQAFNKVGISDTDRLVNQTYDTSKFVPDYVIVNAGGNDYNAYINQQTEPTRTAAIDKFKLGVHDFIVTLHTNYPSTKILWTVPNLSSGNGSWAYAVISDLDPSGAYVKAIVIPGAGDDGDPMGANGHPSVYTHIRASEILATTIETWSGIVRVRSNIVYPR